VVREKGRGEGKRLTKVEKGRKDRKRRVWPNEQLYLVSTKRGGRKKKKKRKDGLIGIKRGGGTSFLLR